MQVKCVLDGDKVLTKLWLSAYMSVHPQLTALHVKNEEKKISMQHLKDFFFPQWKKIKREKNECGCKQVIITFNQLDRHVELLAVALLFFGLSIIQRHHLQLWGECLLILDKWSIGERKTPLGEKTYKQNNPEVRFKAIPKYNRSARQQRAVFTGNIRDAFLIKKIITGDKLVLLRISQ